MANYKQMAASIIEGIGGKDNISTVVHCVTRLRFTLKDQTLFKKEQIESISGVLGTMYQNGQYQVIIGQTVPDVYDEVCRQTGIAKQSAIDENLDDDNTGKKKFRPGVIFEVISGVFAPIVSALAGAGILKGLLTLCTNFGWIDPASGIYIVLQAASDATFYFLPFLLAYTAAKRFKTNTVLALVLAGVYMYPTIMEGAGTQINVLGMNIYLVKYSSSVIPILLSVWLMSYVYGWLNKHSPSYLRVVLVPIGTLLVMAPLSLMILGPIGYNVGIYVGRFFAWLFSIAPWLGGFVDGFTRPLVVFTGTHMTLSPIMINNIDTLGYDMLGPVHCAATYAAAGMCLGAFLKAKNANTKATSFSALISGLIGITEPALYGIAFRFKRPLLACMIGGGIAGALTAALGGRAISFAMPSMLSLPVYLGSIPAVLIGSGVGFAVSAILRYVFGFNESIEKDDRAIEAEKKNVLQTRTEGNV